MFLSFQTQQGCSDHDLMMLLRQFATNQSDSKWSLLTTGDINTSCMELNGSFEEFHGIHHHDYRLLVHEVSYCRNYNNLLVLL